MPKEKPLTISRLSLHSLRRKPFRTGSLIAVVFILAFALFCGEILSACLRNGLNVLEERLGADIVIVPMGYDSQYEGILLSGEPVNFYFDRQIEQKVASAEGVAQVTTQFYLATLSSSCCSVPVQIIGIDPNTDFITNPWISECYKDGLKDNQMIVGANIILDENKNLTFFNHECMVVAKLEKTSTGMDNSVFVTLQTARDLARAAKDIGIETNVDEQNIDIDNIISSVLIKIKPGYSANNVIVNIQRMVDKVTFVKTKSIISSISKNLGIINSFVKIFSISLWILAVIILSILFSVMINGRKKEFSILRILGATRKRLAQSILAESLIISVAGSLMGVLLGAGVIFPFSTYIGVQLGLPFLMPEIDRILMCFFMAFILSVIIGPASSIYATWKISQAETYATLREGE